MSFDWATRASSIEKQVSLGNIRELAFLVLCLPANETANFGWVLFRFQLEGDIQIVSSLRQDFNHEHQHLLANLMAEDFWAHDSRR